MRQRSLSKAVAPPQSAAISDAGGMHMDVAWQNGESAWQDRAPAAKMHVLALEPIKERLGPRWPKLSELVHKLFENSIVRMQSPADCYVRLDELSYAAIFRSLSLPEATRVCNAIAADVCRVLFGDQIEEVSVRTVIAEVTVPSNEDATLMGEFIEAQIERSGQETIIAQSIHDGLLPQNKTISGQVIAPAPHAVQQLQSTQTILASLALGMAFFPMWDLGKKRSFSMSLAPFRGTPRSYLDTSRRTLNMRGGERELAELETILLFAAEAYAKRLHDAGMICAVGVGVSYETISNVRLRARYLAALQKVHLPPANPLLLKLSAIPVGTPPTRVGELAAMIRHASVRVLLEFEALAKIPRFEFRVNAVGVGSHVPKNVDEETLARQVKAAADTAALSKLFFFLEGLKSQTDVEIATASGVRFGAGSALSLLHYSGLEDIPSFPIYAGI
jgi:hypothetical protein